LSGAYNRKIMGEPISGTIEEIGKEVAKGMVSKAGNDRWSNNMMSFMMLSAMLSGGLLWFFYIAKPQADAQIESIRATNESNKLNAETNKLNAETNRENVATNQKMGASLEAINTHLIKSSDRMNAVVEKLQTTEDIQTKTLEKIANTINREPDKTGG
jgi:hypothetical protein